MGLTHRHPHPSQIRSLGNKPGQITKPMSLKTSAFSFEVVLNEKNARHSTWRAKRNQHFVLVNTDRYRLSYGLVGEVG